MSFADDLEAEAPKRNIRCIACTWYEELPPENKRLFDAHVDKIRAAGKQGYAGLHRVVQKHGLRISYGWFVTHMKEHHGFVC